jgi:hypothetical protein
VNPTLSRRFGRGLLWPPLLGLDIHERRKLADAVWHADKLSDVPERWQQLLRESEDNARRA